MTEASGFGTSPRGTALKYCNSDMACNIRGFKFSRIKFSRSKDKYAKFDPRKKYPVQWNRQRAFTFRMHFPLCGL